MTVGELLVKLGIDDAKFTKGLESAKTGLKVLGVAGVAAMGAIGAAVISASGESKRGLNQIIASTDYTIEDMETLKGVMDNVVKSNYGEGFEDVANSISLISQQIHDLNPQQLEEATRYSIMMRDVFDQDVNESIRGVNALINEFGLSIEDAFNLMAQGAQKGLNQNKDLADQLSEYIPLWGDLGFTAEEVFNALVNGAEAGVYQIDFLNDIMKEFGIRTKDNSKLTRTAFKQLGLDADEFGKSFAAGGDKARAAFEDVTTALWNIKDNLLRNEIGVALFGVKWEDMGEEAVKALTNTQGEISLLHDSLKEIDEIKYDSLGSTINAIKNQFKVLLSGGDVDPQEIADNIELAITQGLGIFENVLPSLIEIGKSPELKQAWGGVAELLMNTFGEAWDEVDIDQNFKSHWEEFTGRLADWIMNNGDVSSVKQAWGDVAEDIMSSFASKFGDYDLLGEMKNTMEVTLEADKQWLEEKLSGVFDLKDNFQEWRESTMSGVTDWGKGINDKLTEKLNEISGTLNTWADGLSSWFAGISDMVSGASAGVVATAANVASTVQNVVNNNQKQTTVNITGSKGLDGGGSANLENVLRRANS